MKFEINEETGMISLDFNSMVDSERGYTYASYFEQILQAVKKTQTKLINKDIQEIQDSKNPSSVNGIQIYRTDKDIENQKVARELKHALVCGHFDKGGFEIVQAIFQKTGVIDMKDL